MSADNPEQYITLAWISPETGGQGRLTLINRLLRLALEILIHPTCHFFSLLTSSILTLPHLINLKSLTPNHLSKLSLEGGGYGPIERWTFVADDHRKSMLPSKP